MTYLDTLDVGLQLGVPRNRVTVLLAHDPARYGAVKQRGTGIGATPYRERWRVPLWAVDVLRADLARAKS